MKQSSEFAVMAVLLFIALAFTTPVARAQQLYQPELEECAEKALDIGEARLGAHIGSLCSRLTMWWPGNERRCCETILEYVGEGGDLQFCLCDEAAAELIKEKLSVLSIDTDSLPDKCRKHDVEIPISNNDHCPPPRPAPSASPPPEAPAPAVKQSTTASDGPVADPPSSSPASAKPSPLTPTQAQCVAKAEEIGQSSLVSSLASCFLGSTDSCCNKAQDLLGPGGDLEYCVCDPESISFITVEAEKFGIDVISTLKGCLRKGFELPAEFNEYCPSASSPPVSPPDAPTPPPKSTPPPSPAVPPSTVVATPPDYEAGSSNQLSGDEQAVVSLEECTERAEAIGEEELIARVSPCLAGPIPACCSSALELVGPGAPLEFCLCDKEAARFITDRTDELSFDLQGILDGCLDESVDLPFFGNEYCPSATALDVSDPVEVVPLPQGMDALPTEKECVSKAEELGEVALLGALTPCLGGPSAECCEAAESVAGPGGDLAFCLCQQTVVDDIVAMAENLQLGVNFEEYTANCSGLPVLSTGNCPTGVSQLTLRSISSGDSSQDLPLPSDPSAIENGSPAPQSGNTASSGNSPAPVDDPAGMPGWVIAVIVVAIVLVATLALIGVTLVFRHMGKQRERRAAEHGVTKDAQPAIGSGTGGSEGPVRNGETA